MSSKKKEDIFKDARFSHLTGDPRFKHMPQSEQKVKIDKRFKSMFENEKFKVKYTVDKYGRQMNKTSSEDLKKYYELSSSEDEEEPETEPKEEQEIPTEDQKLDEDGNTLFETSVELPMTIRDKLKNLDVDYIRGEGVLQSDSSSDEDSSEDEGEELFIEHVWGELDREAERTDDSSRRIAACNMDWDRLKAVDIMVLCNSFLPPGGSILSVKIFPSEFGKTRMAEEEMAGPQELTTNEAKKDEDLDEQVDEEDEAYKEKLREYQLNRLKYFYAVIECDSVQTADKMYAECDGLEYESTANRLDLRFIPDELEFDDEPKDECTELPDLSNYKPRMFFTTALQQAKVELTWDENDVDRTELTEKLFTSKSNEVADSDLRRFVACSSSEEEEDEVQSDGGIDSDINSGGEGTKVSKIDRYKALLGEIKLKEDNKKAKQVEMEFTWGTGLDKKSESKNKVVEEELTPFEQILEKKRLKKKSKKEERKQKFKAEKASGSEDSEEDQNGYSSDDVDVDLNDPYFAEEFANGEFDKPKKPKKKVKEVNPESEDEEARKQAELALLLDDGQDEKAHFSLKKIQDSEDMSKSKRKRKFKKSKGKEEKKPEAADNFKMNVGDNRFAAVFSEPDFNIDPTDSHFKKTKGMEVLIHEKLKRRQPDELPKDSAKKPKKDVSMKILIKNVKRKIAHSK